MENNFNIASAGKRGDGIRSDCYIELEKSSGGINIEIKSKVSSMYGESLHSFINEMCKFFNITNLNVKLEDFGALPFVVAARFEAALKKLYPEKKEIFVPKKNKFGNYSSTVKDRQRRSRLYLPGNEPKFFVNAGLHKPDAIILDLEDSVAPLEKEAARYLVRNSLAAVNFYNAERMVRINQLPMGIDDLRFVVPYNVNVILIPKVESKEQIVITEEAIIALKQEFNITDKIYLMPIIESAKGVLNSFEIAASSDMICALAIGLEDYTADLGTQRTNEGKESFFARSMVINAAKAAGVQAIDTVFSDVNDPEGLRSSVLEAKALGFEGKGCIHPRQIPIINEAFMPTIEEIEKANKIVEAYNEALANGSGVVALGSKMIDAPVVKRALKTLSLIENSGGQK